MNLLAWPLVIFGTALMAMLVSGCLTSRPATRTERLADPQPMPGEELPRAGRFMLYQDEMQTFAGSADQSFELAESHDPFATGPILLSDTMAANAELGRWTTRLVSETDWLIEQGERKIGPTQPRYRWLS